MSMLRRTTKQSSTIFWHLLCIEYGRFTEIPTLHGSRPIRQNAGGFGSLCGRPNEGISRRDGRVGDDAGATGQGGSQQN
jgi:hypothetical protein